MFTVSHLNADVSVFPCLRHSWMDLWRRGVDLLPLWMSHCAICKTLWNELLYSEAKRKELISQSKLETSKDSISTGQCQSSCFAFCIFFFFFTIHIRFTGDFQMKSLTHCKKWYLDKNIWVFWLIFSIQYSILPSSNICRWNTCFCL